jgi:hypothetical protein
MVVPFCNVCTIYTVNDPVSMGRCAGRRAPPVELDWIIAKRNLHRFDDSWRLWELDASDPVMFDWYDCGRYFNLFPRIRQQNTQYIIRSDSGTLRLFYVYLLCRKTHPF